MVKIALVDDHVLLRKGLGDLVRRLGYTVTMESDNGRDFIQSLVTDNLPDIAILDINMPKMDGFATARWLKDNYPGIRVLALSMYDDENSIIRMLRCGASGYILKDTDPDKFREAIECILSKGVYHSDLLTSHLLNVFAEPGHVVQGDQHDIVISPKETEFLKLVCTEMTYKEIAVRMGLSPRTIDGYRDSLFEKLGLKNRVGLVLFAIREGIVKL